MKLPPSMSVAERAHNREILTTRCNRRKSCTEADEVSGPSTCFALDQHAFSYIGLVKRIRTKQTNEVGSYDKKKQITYERPLPHPRGVT